MKILTTALAALLTTCAAPALAQSTFPTQAPTVRAGGTVMLRCDAGASGPTNCRPVTAGEPLPVTGSGGPQPAASSQSVAPATNSAPFPTYTANQAGNVIATVGAPNSGSLSFAEPGLTTRGTLYNFDMAAGGVLTLSRGDATGTYVVGKGGGAIATGQVSVGTAATQIVAARAGRQKVALHLGAANNCAFGPAGITLSTGYPVAQVAGTTLTIDTTAAVFAVCGMTTTIGFIEQY